MKENTNEYYRTSSFQNSVIPLTPTVTTLQEILNDEGTKIFELAESLYQEGKYKDEFHTYAIQCCPAGSWFKDDSNPFSKNDTNEYEGMLNAWNDQRVVGKTQKCLPNESVKTSRCIFVTKEWCLTISGNIYKLGNLVSIYDV